MARLEGKVALITGAGSGMGQEAALLFAREGAAVAVLDIDKEKAEETLRRIRLDGGKAMSIGADVSIEDQVTRATSAVIDEFERIDVLINNAAILRSHDVQKTTVKEWNEVFDVNVKGMFLFCREVIPHMLRQGGGKIVNIASVGGITAFPGSAPYCATKSAVIMFTKGLAFDYAAKNINVNCICPGLMNTPMVRAMMADELTKKGLLLNVPAGRFAEPNEIANGALFLSSDESSYCHGTALVIDGGWTLH